MHEWDSGQYLRFADERTRPAADLLQRVAIDRPQRVVDLGCGPGNSTALLRARWPEAARRGHPGIDFVPGDIGTWRPAAPCDVVFSNAALQWVGDHERLIPRLFE